MGTMPSAGVKRGEADGEPLTLLSIGLTYVSVFYNIECALKILTLKLFRHFDLKMPVIVIA